MSVAKGKKGKGRRSELPSRKSSPKTTGGEKKKKGLLAEGKEEEWGPIYY